MFSNKNASNKTEVKRTSLAKEKKERNIYIKKERDRKKDEKIHKHLKANDE